MNVVIILVVVVTFNHSHTPSTPLKTTQTHPQVIDCGKHTRESGIVWSSLQEANINDYIILKSLRYLRWKDGDDVRCQGQSEAPTEMEEVVLKKNNTSRGFRNRNSTSERKVAGVGVVFFSNEFVLFLGSVFFYAFGIF